MHPDFTLAVGDRHVTSSSALVLAIDWYLTEYLPSIPVSRHTIATYRSELRHLEHYAMTHGCLSPEQLTPDIVRQASVALLAEGARAVGDEQQSTRSKGNQGAARIMITAARGLMNALRSKRGVAAPDLSSVDLPHAPERLQPRTSLDDFGHIQQALEHRRAYPRYPRFLLARDSALVLLLMETGLRADETSRLDVADLDLDLGVVTIREGKGRKSRRVGIADVDCPADGGEVIRRLRTYLAERAVRPIVHSRALWLGVRGHRMTPAAIRTALAELCEEAGIDHALPPHAWRRGWFTAAYREDPRELPILAARMGWSKSAESRMAGVYTRGALVDFAITPRRLVSASVS